MRVISRKKLREAIAAHSEWEASLNAWHKVAKNAEWKQFEHVRQSWRSVDRVGRCVVFDVANNRCRLIVWINYDAQKVFVRYVLGHADYERNRWKDDCHD